MSILVGIGQLWRPNISCPQASVAGHLLWNKAFKDHDIHFHTVVRVPSRAGLPAKQALLGMLVIHKFSWKSSVVFSSPLKDMENKLSLFWNSAPSPWSKTGMHLFFQFGFVSNLWSFHLGPLRSTLFQNSANFFVPKKPWKSNVPSSSMLRWCIQRQGNFNGICLTSTAVALLPFTLQVTGKEAGTNDCGIFFIKSLWQFWWCLPKVPKAAKSCTSLLGQPDSLAACAIFWSVGAEISPCPHKVSKVCAKGLHFGHSLAAMHGSFFFSFFGGWHSCYRSEGSETYQPSP